MNPILHILVYVFHSCRASTHQSSPPTLPLLPLGKKKKKIMITGGRYCSTCQREEKEKKKDLAAPAVSETLPLPSYNKQERQNQNTAPTSPFIHPAQAALLPATAHNHTASLPWHILPGGLNNRRTQLRKPASNAWGA